MIKRKFNNEWFENKIKEHGGKHFTEEEIKNSGLCAEFDKEFGLQNGKGISLKNIYQKFLRVEKKLNGKSSNIPSVSEMEEVISFSEMLDTALTPQVSCCIRINRKLVMPFTGTTKEHALEYATLWMEEHPGSTDAKFFSYWECTPLKVIQTIEEITN